MLKTRVITVLFLLAVFLPAMLFTPIEVFATLIGCVVVFAAWEWARLLKASGVFPVQYAIITALVLIASACFPNVQLPLFWAAAIFWVVVSPYALVCKPALMQGARRWFLFVVGPVLFVACWHALVTARTVGAAFALSLLLVVWLADSGAYFVGTVFGRHKLIPAISPSKTWEGVVGGWFMVLIIASILAMLHAFEPTLYSRLCAQGGSVRMWVVLTVLVMLSVIGDLFESLLKRQAGVKDSSSFLPGHGGILDRIDALLPVLPLALLIADCNNVV